MKSKIKTTTSVFWSLLFCCGLMFGGNMAMDKLNIEKTTNAPVLDGKLNDLCWKKANFIRFSSGKKTGNKVDLAIVESGKAIKITNRPTEFAVLHDKKGIYMAVRCFDPNVNEIWKDCNIPDGLFFWFKRNDMVEVAFGNKAGNQHYWFLTNPIGSKTDIICNSDPDRSWNASWQAVGAMEKNAWTLELFFPYAIFNRIPFSEIDSICISRYIAASNQTATWGGTHRIPATFKKFELKDFESNLEEIGVEDILIVESNSKNKGIICFRLKNNGSSKLYLKPSLKIMRPYLSTGIFPQANGPRSELKFAEISLSPGQTKTLKVAQTILPEENLIAQIELRNKKNDLVWTSYDYILRKTYNIGGTGPEFSYYTKEKDVNLHFEFNRFKDLRDLSLELSFKDKNGKRILQKKLKVSSQELYSSIATSILPMGKNILEARFYRKDKLIGSRDFEILRLEPNDSGSETKTRRWSQSLYVDGKPFIAIGNSPMLRNGLAHAKSAIKNMKENNFNAMHLWVGYYHAKADGNPQEKFKPDFDTLKQVLDEAEKYGMKVILDLGYLTSNYDGSPFKQWKELGDNDRLKIAASIAKFCKRQKAMLGYEIVDEPGFFVDPAWTRKIYDVLEKNDPYHTRSINTCRGTRSIIPFDKASDFIGTDYYPCGKGPISTMSSMTDEMRYQSDWKVVKWWIQGYKIFNPAPPTPKEIIAMTYLVAARGTSMFFYFIGQPEKKLWDAQRQSAKEIIALTPALSARERITLEVKQVGKNVYASFRREHDGVAWVIAVNDEDKSSDVKILLPNSLKGKEVEISRVFEQKNPVAYSKNIIKAVFAPFERQVYRIKIKK